MATMEADRILVTGTLGTMVEIVEKEEPRAPTLIIVGDVVSLHKDLAWFGTSAR